MSIASEITRISGNIADAYTALDGKGATMPASGSQNSANLADTIDTISTGGGSGNFFEQFKTILENDTESYTYKVLLVINDFYDTTTIKGDTTYNSQAVKFSDTNTLTVRTSSAEIVHQWDKTKDIPYTDENINVRYVILYSNSSTIISYIKGAVTDFAWLAPLTTISSLDASWKFSQQIIGIIISAPNNTTFDENTSNFFSNSIQLEYINTVNNNVLNLPNMQANFMNCKKLRYIPETIKMSQSLTYYGNHFLKGCSSLTTIDSVIDWSNATQSSANSTAFLECYNLRNMKLKIGAYTFNISGACNLSPESLEYIANNAPTVSGMTLTIGTQNIANAGGTSGTIISTLTGKGWTVN